MSGDFINVCSLSDDELRSRLMDFGCAAPPITSDTVRRLLRRKLQRVVGDKAIFPEEDQKFSDAEMDDPDVDSAPHGLRQRSAVQYPEGTDQIAGSEGTT
ncbi:hypothetical protein SprV_0200571500 [Sparganum proliferum]